MLGPSGALTVGSILSVSNSETSGADVHVLALLLWAVVDRLRISPPYLSLLEGLAGAAIAHLKNGARLGSPVRTSEKASTKLSDEWREETPLPDSSRNAYDAL
jgi:hypothetical protein